ncbi:M20 aminoacylase family protein [Sinorhizobium meliloti]|uniref:M20 aminoacylase family protein n=1 Tax=Rhizobium meliloti TaxID=382 RepID=UPI000B4A12AE|nr:M20 aminoacylase family protein [Sinorhizobium meliloti]ASP69522.1 amidohydrolase [Sinorhizobium meliloti]MQX01273.1 amidohydrolase [Sinorhizobium meliloti]RVK40134.1 amidohydrolase [Sinorhizobium meliloti]
MQTIEKFAQLQVEATSWRRHLHQYPELDYRLTETANFVAQKLKSFGIDELKTGIAETGIVAIVSGSLGDGPTIGLRADMDALPILENSNRPWSSMTEGLMHGCGHDGHTAMLLGAAKYLATTRNFKGNVALIFQPAEEDGRGAQRMVQEGIMDRYNISRVFGMHNEPGIDVGNFATCYGTIFAALDEFDIIVKGRGGHAADPHRNVDPIVISAQIILGLQTLVSRGTDPLQSLVISVTSLTANGAYNIIPETVKISGTVRSLKENLRDFAEQNLFQAAAAIARGFGGDIEFKYRRYEPVTENNPDETTLAIGVARKVAGANAVDEKFAPSMGTEDFCYMAQARPSAYILIGNGQTASLHNPAYDFNDDAIPYGIAYWVNLVETVLAP